MNVRHTEDIECTYISVILNLRRPSQQLLLIPWASKTKTASPVKRPCFALNYKIFRKLLWQEKNVFQHQRPWSSTYNPCPVTFLPLINNTTSLIDRCLSCIRLLQLSAVSSVHALLFKSMKKAFSRNTLLSVPVEIPDLTPPPPQCIQNSRHKFSPRLQISSSKMPPPHRPPVLAILKSSLWYGMDFSEIAHFVIVKIRLYYFRDAN